MQTLIYFNRLLDHTFCVYAKTYGQIGIIFVRTHLLKTRYHNEAVLFIAFRVCDACAVYQGR